MEDKQEDEEAIEDLVVRVHIDVVLPGHALQAAHGRKVAQQWPSSYRSSVNQMRQRHSVFSFSLWLMCAAAG